MGVRENLERRLHYLGWFDLKMAAVLVAVFICLALALDLGPWMHVGLGAWVILISFGAMYWLVKLQTVRRRAMMSNRTFVQLFGPGRWIIPAVLSALPVIVMLAHDWLNHGWTLDLAVAGGLYLFAWLEFINYYHWQLMYETRNDGAWLARNRKFKRPSLRVDLERGRLGPSSRADSKGFA